MPAVAVWSGIMLATVGALFAGVFVVPLPEDDQPLVPSAFVARTCTRYAVPADRLEIVVEVPVPLTAWSFQSVASVGSAVPAKYRTS